MEQATGLSAEELTAYLAAYRRRVAGENLRDPTATGKALPLSLANSVWLRDSDSLSVSDDFLAACGSRLGAQAFAAAFDQSTVNDVNAWVSDKTHGMIPQLLDEISGDAQLYLINALAFEGA